MGHGRGSKHEMLVKAEEAKVQQINQTPSCLLKTTAPGGQTRIITMMQRKLSCAWMLFVRRGRQAADCDFSPIHNRAPKHSHCPSWPDKAEPGAGVLWEGKSDLRHLLSDHLRIMAGLDLE